MKIVILSDSIAACMREISCFAWFSSPNSADECSEMPATVAVMVNLWPSVGIAPSVSLVVCVDRCRFVVIRIFYRVCVASTH